MNKLYPFTAIIGIILAVAIRRMVQFLSNQQSQERGSDEEDHGTIVAFTV